MVDIDMEQENERCYKMTPERDENIGRKIYNLLKVVDDSTKYVPKKRPAVKIDEGFNIDGMYDEREWIDSTEFCTGGKGNGRR